MTSHESSAEHKFNDDQQYIPSNALHDAVPHEQAIGLSEDPSMLLQTSPRVHALVYSVQKRPVYAVHPESPHWHGELLEVAPLVWTQSGAAKQMQLSMLELPEHDPVVVDNVLYL